MKSLSLTSFVLSLICGVATAQYPISWAVSSGVTGAPPHTRENPAAASLTHMYKFGGRTGNSGGVATNALWEFDGSTWLERTTEGAVGSPPERHQAAVCWDYGRNVLVVFGGYDLSNQVLSDTWEWDPATNMWTQIMVSGPPARRFSSMAWDPSGLGGDVVLFGGLDGTGTHLNDTWMYVGGAGWLQMAPANVPSVRRQHHLITRLDSGDVFLCAGQDASQPAPAKWRTDAWTWNGADWTLIPTANTPAAVVANEAVYDPIRRRVVMVGGNGINGGSPTSQISEFDTVTNDWVVYGYATPGTADPVIGRISRYFMSFLPTTGRIYKISGQNPSGTGAGPTTTVEYGLGITTLYPGNGADVVIDLAVNGSPSAGFVGMHTINPSDTGTFTFSSPGGALTGEVFSAAATLFTTGNPPAGFALLGGQPDVWVQYPSNIIWLVDGIFGTGPSTPTLGAGGFGLGPIGVPPSLVGVNASLMVQVASIAPGYNAVNIGLSDAIELRIK